MRHIIAEYLQKGFTTRAIQKSFGVRIGTIIDVRKTLPGLPHGNNKIGLLPDLRDFRKQEKIQLITAALMSGKTTREAQIAAKVRWAEVIAVRSTLSLPNCECGRIIGHLGTCGARAAKSPSMMHYRKFQTGRYPRPIKLSQKSHAFNGRVVFGHACNFISSGPVERQQCSSDPACPFPALDSGMCHYHESWAAEMDSSGLGKRIDGYDVFVSDRNATSMPILTVIYPSSRRFWIYQSRLLR